MDAAAMAFSYLGHVDEAQGQGLVAQDGPVLVALPPLQHDLQLVGVPLQEVRVLRGQNAQSNTHTQWTGRGGDAVIIRPIAAYPRRVRRLISAANGTKRRPATTSEAPRRRVALIGLPLGGK